MIYLARIWRALPPWMRCFTEDELRRGLDAVILAYEGWSGRCVVCGEENQDAHDAQAHPFQSLDILTVFLKAATHDDDDHEEGQARRETSR